MFEKTNLLINNVHFVQMDFTSTIWSGNLSFIAVKCDISWIFLLQTEAAAKRAIALDGADM